MKKLFIAVLALAITPLLGHAQYATPVRYGLTNTTTFSVTNGSTVLITTTNINSQPFLLIRDRGFMQHVGVYSTNLVTGNVSFVTQFATPIKVGTTWVTNWLSTPTVTNTYALNGTNEVFAAALTAPTTIQNVTLGRLQIVTSTTNAPVYLDPTNTFNAITP